jgi:hypothetical protein
MLARWLPQENAMTRPFEGIRVIDVTHVLAGRSPPINSPCWAPT